MKKVMIMLCIAAAAVMTSCKSKCEKCIEEYTEYKMIEDKHIYQLEKDLASTITKISELNNRKVELNIMLLKTTSSTSIKRINNELTFIEKELVTYTNKYNSIIQQIETKKEAINNKRNECPC
jgi:uncharacterized coiled-coil DUF342 family protein